MSKNDLAVFYRVRTTLRGRGHEATTNWSHDYKIILHSEYEYVFKKLAASKKEAILQCLTNLLDDELSDYEVEITNIQEVTW
jgi:deoxyadenosine/deoxycytidine kinase